MFNIMMAVVAALIVLALFAPRVLRSFGLLADAEANRSGRWAKNIDPTGHLDALIDAGVDQIKHAKDCLEAENTLVRQTQRRVDQLNQEQARLEDRIKTAMNNGDPNHTAQENALSLVQVRQQLASNQEQLAVHRQNCANFAKQVKLGQKKISDARNQAASLEVELQESKREAELSEFAQSFDQNGITGSIHEATTIIQNQIDQNRAKSSVAAELNQPAVNEAADDELAQKSQADAILNEFRPKQPA
jgi:phage shock protein A